MKEREWNQKMKTSRYRWLAGFLPLLLLVSFAASGCTPKDVPEVLSKPVINADEATIAGLLEFNNTYLGESNRIKELLTEQLPAKEFARSFDITLGRLSISYGFSEDNGLTEENFGEYWQDDTVKQVIFYNSSALFALVKGLESIEYNIEGYPLPTFVITKENMDSFYGQDLRDVTTVTDWQNVIIKENTDKSARLKEFFRLYPLDTEDETTLP